MNFQDLPPLDTKKQDTLQEMPRQGPEKDQVPSMTTDASAQGDSTSLLTSNPKLQRFTPSSMLAWGQFETRYFQQIYSQSHYFDAKGKPQAQGHRSTYYTGILSVNFGCKPWFNFGMDLWLRSVRIGDPSESPFKIFSFQSGPNSRTAISAIAPKLKFQPFRKWNGFTVQTSLLIPVGRDMEGVLNGRPFLATENLVWWTQFYWTKSLAQRWQLFAEVDAYASFHTRGASHMQPSAFAAPVSVYLSFFPTRRLTLYIMNQAWPTSSTIWYQAALGGKYRLGEGLELEAMYGRFLAGVNAAGQANAFNLGLRFVKW